MWCAPLRVWSSKGTNEVLPIRHPDGFHLRFDPPGLFEI